MKSLLVFSISVLITLGLNNSANAQNKGSAAASSRTEADLARDHSSKPKQILNFLGVKKGDHVLDFLGGGGYYSQILADRVGEQGHVVLQTNRAYLKYVGKALKKRTKSGGLNGVTQLISEADDLKLGDQVFDSAILVLGYHDFFHKDDGWDFPADVVIPQLRRSLKKGGKLLIIDHSAKKGAGDSVTKSLHRIEDTFVKNDIISRGFRFLKESDILRNPNDSREILVFDPTIRRKTDRFVYLFEKQ